jgi:hypothetical protein
LQVCLSAIMGSNYFNVLSLLINWSMKINLQIFDEVLWYFIPRTIFGVTAKTTAICTLFVNLKNFTL